MIRIGIVGTGGMASGHVTQYSGIRGCKVVAACDIVKGKAEAFAHQRNIPEAYTDLNKLLKQADVDAVSVVASDKAHAPISLAAIAKGKHVLCEKPLATNYRDAKKMTVAAKCRRVINMVNFSYRQAPAIYKAHDLVKKGVIGKIMHVEAAYLQSWLASAHWGGWRERTNWMWRLSTKHGSAGVLGDLGVHLVDFVTFPAGDIKQVDCRLKAFPKAKGNRIGEYVLDANDSAVATFELAGGGMGVMHTTRWGTGHSNTVRLRLHGDKGAIVVDLDQSRDTLQICRGKDIDKLQWKTLKCGKVPTIYQRFIKSIRTGKQDQPDFARGAAVQKVLDACFESDRKRRPVRI